MEIPLVKRVIVVTTAYPSAGQPYRNMFVHTRLRHYLRRGIETVVLVIDNSLAVSTSRTFEGVTVLEGNAEYAAGELEKRKLDTVLIHFISPGWFRTLRPVLKGRRTIVWLHGFEAEAWHRRWYNATGSYKDLQNLVGKRTTTYAARRRFFRDLVEAEDLDLHFVAVSDWFFQHVLVPDAGIPADRCTVIPNPVDLELYPYRRKRAEDRLRILTIRPFTSPTYGNDLVVRAILHLRASPVFDQLRFSVIGEGPLFEDLVKPLRELENVNLVNRMLEPHEIAEEHSRHGVFLSPGRGDSQGVSRCEAMASGLVPVSSAVSAVPEFVADGVTGLLAPPEDWKGLADRIEQLAADPDLFLRLSDQAAAAARRQCGSDTIIEREIELILGTGLPTVASTGLARSQSESLQLALQDIDGEFARALRRLSVELRDRDSLVASLEKQLASSEETSEMRKRSFIKSRERARALEASLKRRMTELASVSGEADSLRAELDETKLALARRETPSEWIRRGAFLLKAGLRRG